MDNSLNQFFSEITSWEVGPINELLHNYSKSSIDTAAKRIVVYGPTQVGKTTVILDLIGILPERQRELEKILRGNAKSGNSSTSTAIIYSQWGDEHFGLLAGNLESISENSPQKYTPQEFTQAISDINKKNRSKSGSAAVANKDCTVLYYYIPKQYFSENAPSSLQVVDLPGFGERNQTMSHKIDDMINRLSRHVAGAIIVAKSENIVKLESEYKPYIERHSNQQLAIAVSFAMATSKEVKDQLYAEGENAFFADCATDRKKAEKLSQHYHELIRRENYMPLPACDGDPIVFPMEHSGWLAENYPELSGVFAESRKMLRERISRMENMTSIDACVAELARIQKSLTTLDQKLQKDLIEYTEAVRFAEKTLNDRTTYKAQQEKAFAEVTKKTEVLKQELEQIGSGISSLNRALITEGQAGKIWDSCGKADSPAAAFNMVREKIKAKLDPPPKNCKPLYNALMSEVDRKLAFTDFSSWFKKRDGFLFKKFSYESCNYAAESSKYLAQSLRKVLLESFKRQSDMLLQEAEEELRQAKTTLDLASRVLHDADTALKRSKALVAVCEERIATNKQEIQNVNMDYTAVKAVFIKHYLMKADEMKRRIEDETSPETKMALLLTLSAIHMSMKPYLQEDL